MFLNEDEYWAHVYGDDDRVATPAEACREYARNVGAEFPEKPWILTDYDTWEKNPYYTGAKCWRDTYPESVDEAFTEVHYHCGEVCLHGFGDPVYGPTYRPYEAGKAPGSDDDIPF